MTIENVLGASYGCIEQRNYLRMNFRFEKITFPLYEFEVTCHLQFDKSMAYSVCISGTLVFRII